MTEVIGKSRNRLAPKFLLVPLLILLLQQLQPASVLSAETAAPTPKPAEQLYLQLRSVELDPARVYDIREAALDYPKLHITFDDGKIGFTSDIYGKITGAFFEGDGELLVVPPDQSERASLVLFTGAAILEERFHTAYFRFNDNTFSDLQPYLRLTEGKDFVGAWGDAARNLASGDALRMFMSFSRCLPEEGQMPSAPACESDPEDRFLHARIQSGKLGVFDVAYDSQASEQVSIGQQKIREGIPFYNTWTQFTSHAAHGQRPPQFPNEIAIRSYDIDVQVNPPANLQGKAKLKIDVLRSGSRALLFELSRDLKVSSITADGAVLEFIQNQAVEGTQLARRGNDMVAVVFPKALQSGQAIEFNFNYAGDVLSEAGGGLMYVGARGIWYPNRGMEAARFDLHFRYPAGWSLLATGERVATNESSDESQAGTPKSSHWLTRVPIPVAGFNLSRYSRAEARAGGATVETYAASGVERTFPKAPETEVEQPRSLPGLPSRPSAPLITAPPVSPARNAQMVADTAAAAINFYAQRFGPYPYGSLRLTQMPGPLSQGWPGLIFLSSYSFLLPAERARMERDAVDFLLSKQVTAHETAHEWWGDLIYWRGYRDQWLSEGLANYCSLMILESENPAGFHQVMTRYRDNLLEKNKDGAVLKDAGPVTLGLRLSSSEFPDGYEAISYGRGTWLFHMLRHMLDDEPSITDKTRGPAGASRFFHALLNLREQYAGKPVTTREVLQVFAEELPPSQRYEGKKQLQWFYDGWVNGMAIPHLQLQNVKFTEGGRSLVASGTILQKDAPYDLVTSVPLFAQLPGNRRVLAGRVFADGPEATFHIPVPAGTRKLLLDSDDTVLRN